MLKKVFAIVCSLIVSAAALTACGDNNESSSAPEPSSTASSETESAESKNEAPETFEHKLSNPNANADALRTYNYLYDNFGKVILTAQQESTWKGSPDYEMDLIQEATGKLPAIRGLDFMNRDFNGVVKRATEWHEKGGIVTICWHTGVEGSSYNACKDEKPDFEKLLTPGTDEYKTMMETWDRAASALSKLQNAGVAVLWRPFHEFDGQWFWWGKGGSENFIKLWRMMYDYFTNEKGLNNLIWVLGYSGTVKDGWYPGDEYCDIIGSDTYDNSTNKKAWDKLSAMNTGKIMTFHECGNVPSVSDFENDGDLWSWFMIWHTEHIEKNPKDNLKEVYNSEKVITLDELPKL